MKVSDSPESRKPVDVRRMRGARETVMMRDGGYFPVLTALSSREVIAVVRGGAGHIGIEGRLDLLRSMDGGETWLPPFTVAQSEWDDRNPALGQSRDGTLILAYHHQGSYDEGGRYAPGLGRVDTYVTRSRDFGYTWEPPRPLSLEPFRGRSPYGKIVTLPDGTLLMPVYGERTGVVAEEAKAPAGAADFSYVLRSRDDGLTWEDPSLIAAGFNEAGLVRLGNGELLAALRSEARHASVSISRSADDGYTWTRPEKVTEASEHPGDLLSLGGDRVLLTYGRRHPPHGVRGLLSHDNGRTWGHDRELVYADDRPGPDCGYPSSVLLTSGRVITAYYSAGDHMDAYRHDGAFAKAVLYGEEELLEAITP
ncbi:MAG: sialidase family protein [Candidatus Bathyarchaeia archaeon]